MIAVVGGGGKTSLLFRLAEECREAGKTVALTTTTHMGKRSDFPMTAGGAKEEIFNLLQQEKVVLVGEQDQKTPEKISGVDLDTLKYLKKSADVVLVEADGSKHLPLKAHASYEPVVPPESSHTILVAGASGFGAPISQAVHRPERFCTLTGAQLQDLVTPELAALAIAREGLARQVFLNQVESRSDWAQAEQFARALQGTGIQVFAGSLHQMSLSSLPDSR